MQLFASKNVLNQLLGLYLIIRVNYDALHPCNSHQFIPLFPTYRPIRITIQDPNENSAPILCDDAKLTHT